MKAAQFCVTLRKHGFNFFVGVPCTIFKEIIVVLSTDPNVLYIPATREEEAIGIATGASLGGRRVAVLMQNSGFGNSIGALASLPLLYKIPMLLLISWRGYLEKDAPEHLLIGKCLIDLLDDIEIHTQILTKGGHKRIISTAIKTMEKQQAPVALLIERGVIE